MTLPLDTKETRLRRYLAEDNTFTRFDSLEEVPRGWTFVELPEGGVAAWRKPPLWALRQPPQDPIRLRTRLQVYRPELPRTDA